MSEMRTRLRIVAGAGLLAVALSQSAPAATVQVRQTVVARQSMPGRFDAAYLDGNDGTPLAWGTCPAFSFVVGDSCAVNLRTACSLTGTNALTATLAKDSGTLPAGCSAGTNGLTGTVSGALAPSAVVWSATDGVSSVTAPFSIAATAAPVGDTTAPTIPTGCSGTGGTGTVTISCDQSSDPYVSEAGSGVASYKIYLGGVLVGTKTAPASNIQSQMAGVTVGSADGTQSCTRTGANLAMSGGGAGLSSTADQLYGCGYQIPGDFVATAKVTGFAGAVTTGTAGLMVRASTVAGSIYGTARARDSDDKVNNRYRLTTDAAAGNGAFSVAQTYPHWVRMAKTATGITPSISSDGNVFTALETERAISFGASPYILAFHASGTAGTNSTSGLDQVNIANATAWTHDHTTNTGGSYQVSAVDADGNESDKSAAFTATPSEPSGGGGGACTGDQAPTLVHYDDFDDAAVDTNRWNAANCQGYDAYAPSQDTCPTPSANHARSGARSLRTRLTYHDGTVTDAPAWSAGSSYSVGDEVTSGSATPMTFRWRSKTNHGPNATTPANDSTNWETWDHWYHKGDYGKTADNAHRSELSIKSWNGWSTGQITQSLEQWYGFSMYVLGSGDSSGDPAIDPSASNYWYFINWQLHDVPDSYVTTATSVPNSTSVVLASGASTANGYYVGTITIGGQTRTISGYTGSTRTVTVSSAFSPTPSPGAVTIKEPSRNPPLVIQMGKSGAWSCSNWYQSAKFAAKGDSEGSNGCSGTMGNWTDDVGEWVDFVVRLKATYTSSGVLEIWKNGVKVYSHFGPTWPNDDAVGYFKTGIYNGHFSPGTNVPTDWPQRQAIYLDSHKLATATSNPTSAVGTDNCAYQMVAPTGTSH